MMMTESKGFTLGVLRESLLKCKGDSQATRGRIKRTTIEIDEVDKRTIEQVNANTNLKAELSGMKKRRDDLNEDILKTNQYLDSLTRTNCDFIKDKVVSPAEQGILVAKESIDCFREIIDSSYKLNMLFKREHPEKATIETQISWPFENKKLTEENDDKILYKEICRQEKELFNRQEVLRDAKSIARGNKSSKNNFVTMSRSEWEKKEIMMQRLRQEELDLIQELDLLENPDKSHETQLNADGSISVPVPMDADDQGSGMGGDGGDSRGSGPAVVVQSESEWSMPAPPQAVPVADADGDDDDDLSSYDQPGYEQFDE